jgi:hypothetical protein
MILIKYHLNNSKENEEKEINLNEIHLGDSSINRIVANSLFYRLYTNSNICSTHGLYIVIDFDYFYVTKTHNGIQIHFNTTTNMPLINKMLQIENNILCKFNETNPKNKDYQILNEILNGYILVPNSNLFISLKHHLLLKISGLWETNTSIGLAYKFFIVNKVQS